MHTYLLTDTLKSYISIVQGLNDSDKRQITSDSGQVHIRLKSGSSQAHVRLMSVSRQARVSSHQLDWLIIGSCASHSDSYDLIGFLMLHFSRNLFEFFTGTWNNKSACKIQKLQTQHLRRRCYRIINAVFISILYNCIARD